jgi:ATP-dependent Clp protease protease subunit
MNFPHIWKSGQRPGIYIDLATYLLENRTIFIGPEITSEVASLVAMQILALSQEKGPISLYLNCNGGSVPAGLAIVDLVRYVDRTEETPVNTYCIGECIGVACAILISGRKGERRAFPSARISLYQEWYGAESLWGARSQDSHERSP